jgi:protein O-mannosyl-transferase
MEFRDHSPDIAAVGFGKTLKTSRIPAFVALIGLVTAAYANHFNNPFHFDDSHAVVDNPYIRDLHNLPLFFTDTDTFSTLPANRSWRPIVTASLAIDYALAGGLKPFAFQASTFFWYLIQLLLMYVLFLRLCQDRLVSLFATALYGVHPAMAETVNYVIQRGDVYSTLGVVAALVLYAQRPQWRKYGFYLLPLVLALLSKPPALIFPAILFTYVFLYEENNAGRAFVQCLPALLVTAFFGILSSAMTPATSTSGAVNASGYRLTQPLVALRYFRTFFIPDSLSADTDHVPVNGLFDGGAWLGVIFVVALLGAAVWCAKKNETKPLAFGLFWFILALIPTSVFALAEVENDHRMFFPFVGLSLSVCWTLALILRRTRIPAEATAIAAGLVLTACAWGTMQRNEVWRSDESLWKEVTIKSPRNGRGLMNYGLSLMSRGDYPNALDYFTRALVFNPNYMVLEVNLGVVNGAMHRDTEAEQHYLRAISLAPNEAIPNYFYAVWLDGKNREADAVSHLQVAVATNPSYMQAQYLLLNVLAKQGGAAGLRAAATLLLSKFPSDTVAQSFLARASNLKPAPPASPDPPAPVPNAAADALLNQSLAFYQQGKFQDSINAARGALKLRPGYAAAWNNIAAAYNSLQQWDEGIEAGQEAVRLDPNFQLARNNLAWAVNEKAKSARPH